MMEQQSNPYCQREISFCSLNPREDQARDAKLLLSGIEGIIHLLAVQQSKLHVHYDLRKTCLLHIEIILESTGFHLDNSLMTKLKRALYHYTEEVQRENLKLNNEHNQASNEIFINRYARLKHGCRDHRSQYWRRYL